MKVLFAVSSESISDAIIKKYQKEYKEILSYKNVYYFNAILKEIQKDKTYDRIIISEDLEPFSNNNYDTIDKFIFEKLDNISDEAQDSEGKETSIILICTDRHTKGSSFLVKLFGIGVYNALLGNDRSMEEVCKLIKKPRVKKEAKLYYKIDAEDVSYDPKSENEVSELEIQNILTHFKKISKNRDKFADSFNNIASQYTDEQLKIIINCLPINVKAVLEEECPKYQELMSAAGVQIQKVSRTAQMQDVKNKTGIKIDILENKNNAVKMSGPIVIPSSVKTSKNRGPVATRPMGNAIEQPTNIENKKVVKKVENKPINKPIVENDEDDLLIGLENIEETVNEIPNQKASNNDKNLTPSMFLENDTETDDSLLLDFEEEDTSLEFVDNEQENDDLSLEFTDDSDELLPDMLEDEEVEEDNLSLEFDDEELNLGLEESQEDDFNSLLPDLSDEDNQSVKKGRGRPRKNPVQTFVKPKGKRGRPRKVQLEQEVDEIEDDDSLELNFDEEIEDTSLELVNDEQENNSLELDFVEEDDDLSLEFTDDSDELLPDMLEDEEVEEDSMLLDMEDEEIDDSLELVDEEVEENEDDLTTLLDYEEESDEDEYTEEVSIPGIDELDDITETEEDSMLPGFEEYEEVDNDDYLLPGLEFNEKEAEEDSLLLNLDDDMLDENLTSQSTVQEIEEEPILNNSNNYYATESQTNQIESIKPQIDYSMSSLNSLLTKDKKIVTFIGTTKNGTSFLINNLAALFSSLGINTAILDMTKNRNSYYIYTKNEEELRKIAYTSIEKLQNGFPEGIKVDKNLTVYTALPNDGKDYSNAEPILSTLVQNHSLILIDCDFDTDPSYFASCQEIYLVQSMDILTIQPLTAFLRDLKAQGVLESEKVRVVINKEIKVRSLTSKIIIGGMSFYNDPAMSFMTELFNKDMVKACSIPFEDNAYSKYLDAMVNCNVSLNGYSREFLSKLRILGDMVYPLTSKQTYSKQPQGYGKSAFSNSINNTLNQMKNKY